MVHRIVFTIVAATLSVIAASGAVYEVSTAIFVLAICVAILGVPHGGLDHWVGRRLLAPKCGEKWPLIFLPAYLFAGFLVAFSWYTTPVQTVVLFFLVSAWHFGREDGLSHLEAVAVGGLIIWVSGLVRPVEMESILQRLIISDDVFASRQIVATTRWLGVFFIPIAVWALVFGDARRQRLPHLATIMVATATPILWSFPCYFCGWHSVRGLLRLRGEEGLSWRQFLTAVSPLSFGAVALILFVGLGLGQSLAEPTGQMRLLFIGLASIAVPHLILHEIEQGQRLRRQAKRQRQATLSGEIGHVA